MVLIKTLARMASVFLAVHGVAAQADAVTEWNAKLAEVVAPTPIGAVPLAMVHTAVYRAVNSISGRYPQTPVDPPVPRTASIDAAVAAAHRNVLLHLLPVRQAAIDAAYQSALAGVVDAQARTDGVAAGERAAARVIAQRKDQRCNEPDAYRPITTPGVYVPTLTPIAANPVACRPWLLARPDELRPLPPPPLNGAIWARDYSEIKTIGARASTQRSAEQSDIARFWVGTASVFYPLLQAAVSVPGREVTANARLLALASQTLDDTATAFFEAKYHYMLWRPLTAIRNGDQDGNEATERDARWAPLIETPMHPEYPCAHCAAAAALASVLKAELGSGPWPPLRLPSVAVAGAVRQWSDVDAMVTEVSDSRVWGGVHYRFSTIAGEQLGRRVVDLALARFGREAP